MNIGTTFLVMLQLLLENNCTGSISIQHSPLYQPRSIVKDTELQVEIQGNETVTSAILDVSVGDIADCAEFGALGSPFPCRDNVEALEQQVPLKLFKHGRFGSKAFAFKPGTLVTYRAKAVVSPGCSIVSDEVSFVVGPVSLLVLRPVFWHRPNASDMLDRIDIVLVPEATDYDKNYGGFVKDALNLIEDVFFDNIPNHVDGYAKFRRAFNIWLGPREGVQSGPEETIIISTDIAPLRKAADGWVLLRNEKSQNFFVNWAQLGVGGEGSVKVGPNSGWRFTHESGHFLSGQADEYPAGKQEPKNALCPNTFSSEDECVKFSALFFSDKCEQVTAGRFRIVDATFETMALEICPSGGCVQSEWGRVLRRCLEGRVRTMFGETQ